MFAVGILSVDGADAVSPATRHLTDDLKSQVDLNSINFVTNDHLEDVLSTTTATPEQVDAAVALNEEARLRALKISLLGLASIALLAIIPAGRMPNYRPGDLPAELSSGHPASEEELEEADHEDDLDRRPVTTPFRRPPAAATA